MKRNFLIPVTLSIVTSFFCSMVANADSFTDGIRKRIADGQIEIKMADSPILDDIFDRTYEQRMDGVVEYIASMFRKQMTEKEFKEWMTYKPSKEEIDYENRLQAMQDEVMKDKNVNWSTDSIIALLSAGKEVEMIEAKPCSESFKKAYDHYVAANWLSILYDGHQALRSIQGKDPLAKKAWDIWENNMKNGMMNAYIERSTEKQLKEFSRKLKFDKSIKAINVENMDNMFKLFEATFGVTVEQVQEIVEKKEDDLVSKYGHQTVDFNVGFFGLKRVYSN